MVDTRFLPGRHSVKVESKAKEKSQMMFIPVPFGVGLLGGAIMGADRGGWNRRRRCEAFRQLRSAYDLLPRETWP